MFLRTENFNEGGLENHCKENKRKEMVEGENPKLHTKSWNTKKSDLHVNSKWQKLR